MREFDCKTLGNNVDSYSYEVLKLNYSKNENLLQLLFRCILPEGKEYLDPVTEHISWHPLLQNLESGTPAQQYIIDQACCLILFPVNSINSS